MDRVLNSTPGLRASKQATFIEWEAALAGALSERFAAGHSDEHLRLIAMVSIGALRLALEQRRSDPGAGRPLTQRLETGFDELAELA